MSPTVVSRNNALASGASPKTEDPAKVKDAAQQFEALLIGQLMKSARESSGGWLGSGGDSSTDCAIEYADLACHVIHGDSSDRSP